MTDMMERNKEIVWLEPMKRWEEFHRLNKALHGGEGPTLVFGLSEGQKGHMLSSLLTPLKSPCLYITYNPGQARRIYEDLQFYMDDKVMLLPPRDIVFYDVDAHSKDIPGQRLRVLEALVMGLPKIVVASIDALITFQTPPEIFRENMIKFSIGDVTPMEKLLKNFVDMGYERVETVEGPGQFSIRGGILDIFPMTEDNPYRLEFFGDEIDSIRFFDALTQRSSKVVDKVSITPARELIIPRERALKGLERIEKDLQRATIKREKETLEKRVSGLKETLREGIHHSSLENYFPYFYPEGVTPLEYLDPSAYIVLDEPSRIEEGFRGWEREFIENFKGHLVDEEVLPGQGELYVPFGDFSGRLETFNRLAFQVLPKSLPGYSPKAIYNIASRGIPSYHGKLDILAEDLGFWRHNKYSVILLAGTSARAKALVSGLYDLGIEATYRPEPYGNLLEGKILVLPGTIKEGFEYPEGKLAILSDREIYGAGKAKRARKTGSKRGKLDPFRDLRVGDYVVHEAHGIGKYLGIETMVVNDQKRDYLNIKYGGTDKLYIPTDQVDAIQPYIGMDDRAPKLSKLGGGEWQKAKARAQKSVQELAMDLVELYAEREATPGFQFSEDTPWQRQFEDLFPYEETPDQEKAIEDLKRDMEGKRVMDRLLCGDVGYGKTEVAIRGAFKAVMDGKQVALLAPTTILAQQHYNTFVNRFGDFPVKVQVLSRFRTPAQQRDILKALKEGNIDIIIGTHRLLGKDVVFKDLGLLIVDEEQRFGVGHKETIKNLKKNLDVLTLTATPIPRTLHMSLVGIRDISIIETPPEDRHPVQTYVVEYNDSMIRDAILREVQRGGQVYFVYNRVKTMERMAERLRELVPDVRIKMAHGQMSESILENVMMDFYDRNFDLLICSTIIESGLDIPNVNTIIIYDADYYGLSQLYQLRGRVGRSNRRAYAYLAYRKDKILSEVAEKRLRAIKEFTEFGAGFKIAMRDLEIRGSGNILGPEQHGHMTSVGYELYCKLLDEAIRDLKGEAPRETVNTIIDIKVNAHIEDEYIPLEGQKIEVYKKIGAIENLKDKYDVEDELLDRFGDMPKPLTNLIDIAYIKGLGSSLGITEIAHRDKEVILRLSEEKPLSPKLLMVILNENQSRLRYNGSRRPMLKILLKDPSPAEALKETKEILEKLEKLRDSENKSKTEGKKNDGI